MLYTFLKLYTWVTINIMDSSESDTFVSITTSDVFWDGSVVNPTEVLPATAGVSGPRPLTSVLGAGSSVPVSGATTSFQGLGPEGLAVGMVTSCAVATSTCSRPVYSSGSLNPTPGQAMGVTFSGNSGTPVVSFANTGFSGFSQPQSSWSAPPFHPFAFGPQYNPPPFGYPWPQSSVPSAAAGAPGQVQGSGVPASPFRELFSEFRASLKSDFDSLKSDFSSLNTRLSSLESSRDSGCVPSASRAESVGGDDTAPSEEVDADVNDDLLSVAPGSQENSFLEEEEDDSSSAVPTASKGSSESVSVVTGDSGASSLSRDSLRSRVYTLMRENTKVPFLSPPRPKKLVSNFEASCGLSLDNAPSYESFPESNHVISALDVINDGLAKNDFSGKQASGSKFAGFAPASFPGIFSVKDSEIFNSTLGRVFPICDRGISNLLGAKPIDGLRLSQSTWSKSENLLRNSSQVLSTAEHYLSAAGSLLNQLEGEGIAEIKSLLLQVDKSLASSQCLSIGALANFTLAKRSELLDKSSVSENLKDSLLRSPLTDRIFGLSLDQVQQELSKAPQAVSVNVRVNDGKRTVTSSHSANSSQHPVPPKRKKVTRRGKPGNSSSSKPATKSVSKGGQKSSSRP